MLLSYTIVKNVYIERTRTSNFMSAGRIIMNLPISKHLRLATIVMGMTLATSVGAVEKQVALAESGKANDLFCVFLHDDDAAVLAIIKAENNGLARGILCSIDGDNKFIDHSCTAVTGTATGLSGAGKVALYGSDVTPGRRLFSIQAGFQFETSLQGISQGNGVSAYLKVLPAIRIPIAPQDLEGGNRTVGFGTPGIAEGGQCGVRKDAAGGLEISPVKNTRGFNFLPGAPSYVPSAAILSFGGADNGVTLMFRNPALVGNVKMACPGNPTAATIAALTSTDSCNTNHPTQTSCLTTPGYGYEGSTTYAYLCKWTVINQAGDGTCSNSGTLCEGI